MLMPPRPPPPFSLRSVVLPAAVAAVSFGVAIIAAADAVDAIFTASGLDGGVPAAATATLEDRRPPVPASQFVI